MERYLKHSNANSNHSKGIRSIQMQIRTIQQGFKSFYCKFEPFERNSKHSKITKHSKSKSNLSKRIYWQFICNFEPFERDSKHSNANSIYSRGIRIILMEIRKIRKGSKHWKAIRSLLIQILTIRKGFEAFECKF